MSTNNQPGGPNKGQGNKPGVNIELQSNVNKN